MTGAAILDLPLRVFAEHALRRMREIQERVGTHQAQEVAGDDAPEELNATLRREINRAVLKVVNQIDRLPAQSREEAQAALDRIQTRMLTEMDSVLGLRLTDTLIGRFQNTWLSELRSFAADIARRHEALAKSAKDLGAKMANVPAEMLDLRVAPLRPHPGVDARNIYQPLVDEFGPELNEKMGAILERVKEGTLDVNRAKQQLAGDLKPPEAKPKGYAARAERIIRQEVGRDAQEAAQGRMEEVDDVVQGMQKEWLSVEIIGRTRPGHFEAHEQRVPVKDFFLVRGQLDEPFERLMHPKDIRGSPGNVLGCLCSSSAEVTDVSVRPSAMF